MAITVKPADPLSAEARELIAALDAGLSGHYDDENNFPLLPEELVDDAIDFFMAETADGKKVGTIALRRYPDYAEIKRMFVTPKARGQGIAKALLNTAHECARQHGYSSVRLETGSLQDAAIGLYQAAGYVRRGPFGDYPPESEQNIYFEYALPIKEAAGS
ncbi:GNAT family N-acetyltransferase [Hyphobacterium sp. HN65]|uniref:GNAT family N-acetyltransferase n=1 Tax=Hyphobacterium lacteum TaxID=3116575 RepID=A0ABU7LMG2_9PROT|nr:GNAT family N-acetyltransferase [Hyphobacterium sp. HN65]MEE2525116.1 GNAT family N-acetyltransferase [Hyphobacterium sp. HN65]